MKEKYLRLSSSIHSQIQLSCGVIEKLGFREMLFNSFNQWINLSYCRRKAVPSKYDDNIFYF